jgi:hypothetical protein
MFDVDVDRSADAPPAKEHRCIGVVSWEQQLQLHSENKEVPTRRIPRIYVTLFTANTNPSVLCANGINKHNFALYTLTIHCLHVCVHRSNVVIVITPFRVRCDGFP